MSIKEKAAQMVAAAQVITLTSIDENGYPRPAAMVKDKYEDRVIYFSTATNSAKTAHFRMNPKAGILIVEGDDSIVYAGEIEIVTDEIVKRSLWNDLMLPHYPGGVEDPNYTILKFIPRSTIYWIDNVYLKEDE